MRDAVVSADGAVSAGDTIEMGTFYDTLSSTVPC